MITVLPTCAMRVTMQLTKARTWVGMSAEKCGMKRIAELSDGYLRRGE